MYKRRDTSVSHQGPGLCSVGAGEQRMAPERGGEIVREQKWSHGTEGRDCKGLMSHVVTLVPGVGSGVRWGSWVNQPNTYVLSHTSGIFCSCYGGEIGCCSSTKSFWPFFLIKSVTAPVNVGQGVQVPGLFRLNEKIQLVLIFSR